MDKSIDILGNIVNFLLVALIFLAVLAITFKITLKNYNVKTSKIKFYGLFLGMNIVYFAIMVVFMLLADILIKDYKRMPIDFLFCLINSLCIYVTSMLYEYLTDKYTTVFLLIVLGLVIIFVFLYFTYITFKLLNNIVLKQENLQKKSYKKL